jgi:steroid delta-isomerase-like uncharacterized protein
VEIMTPKETEALAHRWHLDVVQAGHLATVDEIATSDVLLHVNGQEIRGVEGAKQLATALRAALSDIKITHHEALVTDDRVTIRWTSDATHRGEYLGVPPTGKRIHIEGLDLFHVRNGKITEAWIEYDNLSVLQQMGVTPQEVQAGGKIGAPEKERAAKTQAPSSRN